MCGSDRTGSSNDSDCDDEDESSMMNWVIPPAHPQFIPAAGQLLTQLPAAETQSAAAANQQAIAAPPDGVASQLPPSTSKSAAPTTNVAVANESRSQNPPSLTEKSADSASNGLSDTDVQIEASNTVKASTDTASARPASLSKTGKALF
jgi:hypothetical protein